MFSVLALVATPCLPAVTHMAKRSRGPRLATQPQGPRLVPIRVASTVCYWRRGRKLIYDCCQQGRDIWDRVGLRQRWHRSISPALWTSVSELAFAIYVACCIFIVPVLCAALLVRRVLAHMMPTRRECLRCFSETMLLCSMWHGADTSLVAVLAWSSWLAGLHSTSVCSCRCMTWLVVCLSQKELRAVRLTFLSLLVYFAPLFGKRAAPAAHVETSNKKPKAEEEWHFDAYASSLKCVRSGSRQNADAGGQEGHIAADFPFVPEEFLGLLLSVYSQDVLRCVLARDRVRTLEIWGDFVREHHALAPSPDAEQELFDNYLKRFANIVLSMQERSAKTDRQRWGELRAAGKCCWAARGCCGPGLSVCVGFQVFLCLSRVAGCDALHTGGPIMGMRFRRRPLREQREATPPIHIGPRPVKPWPCWPWAARFF